MKALSSIVVIVLLLMMSVSLASFAYVFSTGVVSRTTQAGTEAIEQTTSSMLAQIKVESVIDNKVYIRNVGQTDLTSFSVYVNGRLADFSAPSSIAKGEVDSIIIYNFIHVGDVIKVSSGEGVTGVITSPDPCKSSSVVLCLKFDEDSGTIARDSSNYGNDGILGAVEFDTFEAGIDGWVYGSGGWSDPPIQDCTTSAVGECSIKMTDTDGNAGSNRISTQNYISDNVKFELWYKCEPGALWGIMVYDGSIYSCIKGSGTANCGAAYNPIGSFTPPVNCDDTWRRVTYDLGANYPGKTITQTIVGDWNSQPANAWMWFDDFQIHDITKQPSWIDGKYGKALDFDGTDDVVNCRNSESLKMGVESFTLEAWIKTSQGVENSIISKDTTVNFYMLQVSFPSLSRAGFNIRGGGNQDFLSGTSSVNNSEWHHLVGIRNVATGEIYIYVDGNQENSMIANTGTTDNDNSLLIGNANSWGGLPFDGIIDEARVYNKAIY